MQLPELPVSQEKQESVVDKAGSWLPGLHQRGWLWWKVVVLVAVGREAGRLGIVVRVVGW